MFRSYLDRQTAKIVFFFLNIGSILAFLQNCLWLVALLKYLDTKFHVRLHLCTGLSSLKTTLKIVRQPRTIDDLKERVTKLQNAEI